MSIVEIRGPQCYADTPAIVPRLTLTLRIPQQYRRQPQGELNIDKTNWTEEEDKTLLKSHEEFGNRWAQITKLFNGRSNTEVKSRYYDLQNNQMTKENDDCTTSSGFSSPNSSDNSDDSTCTKSCRSDRLSTPNSLNSFLFEQESITLDPVEQEILDFIASDMGQMRFQEIKHEIK